MNAEEIAKTLRSMVPEATCMVWETFPGDRVGVALLFGERRFSRIFPIGAALSDIAADIRSRAAAMGCIETSVC